MKALDSLVRLVTGSRGDVRRITLKEGGKTFRCHVWDDSLWVAVKDVVILSVYERAGIRLSDFPGTVVDAGAHVGLFSVRASHYASSVVALEPNPKNFAILELNIAQNSLANVEALPSALWVADEELGFRETSASHSGSVKSRAGSGHRVSAVTLENLVSRYGPIALLKVDIEGAEHDVLLSAGEHVFQDIEAIVAEVDVLPGRDERTIPRRLTSLGYDVVVLDPPILSTAESVRKIASSWMRLEGETPLKLLVLAVYLADPLLRGIVREEQQVRREGPKYLFAKRRLF